MATAESPLPHSSKLTNQMPIDPKQTLYYKRSRFTTRLPTDRKYDKSHFWLYPIEEDLFRVGLTKFATRMLGDLVEINLAVSVGDKVSIGEAIGTIEGFKAISDLYCVAEGALEDRNAELDSDPTLLDKDPYDRGWLYLIRGKTSESVVDVIGYTQLLDTIVDRMIGASSDPKEKTC